MRIHRFPPIGALILLAALAITSGPGAWASDDPRAMVYGDEDGEENNPTCAWLGQHQGQTWNELKVDEAPNGTHDDQASSDNPGGSGELVLTISDSDGKVFDWSSNIGVDAVVVKGGNRGSNVYFYAPDEATADTRLRSPDNTQGNVPQISHISVCYDEEPDSGQGGGEDPPQNQGGEDPPQDQGESNERPQDDGQQESGDDQPQDQSGQQEGGSDDGDSNDRSSDEPTERTPQDESESGGGDGDGGGEGDVLGESESDDGIAEEDGASDDGASDDDDEEDEEDEDRDRLPFTGAPVVFLAMIGLLLLLTGLAGRRVESR